MQFLYHLADFLALLIAIIILIGLTPRDRTVLFSRKKTLLINKTSREYLTWQSRKKEPVNKLYLCFHGFAGNARLHAYSTAFHNAVDERSVVIYPEASPPKKGQKSGWNAGFCCGSGWVNKVDDVGFIMELIKKLSIQYELGPSQIFVSGFSNGAMFSQRLATDYPEAIAGIVSAAGVIGANNCELKPKKPVAMLMMHGKLDKNVPMSSGYGLNPDFSWKSFDDTVSTWKHANKTKSETVVTHEDITETNYEKGSKPLRTMVFSLYKHSWPGWRLWQINRRVPRASKISVDFFDSL